MLSLFAGILLGAVTVIFALQNGGNVTIQFLAWQATAPLSIVLMTTVFSGVSMALLFLAPGLIRDEYRYQVLRREKREVEDELAQHRFTKKRLPTGAIHEEPKNDPSIPHSERNVFA